MKTMSLTAVLLSYAVIASAQEFGSSYTGAWKQGVSVTNKIAGREFGDQEEIISNAFVRAICVFSNELARTDGKSCLKQVLDPAQAAKALKTLGKINVTVQFLDKNYDPTHPTILRLPAFFGESDFLVRIPYSFLAGNKDELRFNHVALILLGYVVSGYFDPIAKNDYADAASETRRIECLSYLAVGREEYAKLTRAHLAYVYRGVSERQLEALLGEHMVTLDLNVGSMQN